MMKNVENHWEIKVMWSDHWNSKSSISVYLQDTFLLPFLALERRKHLQTIWRTMIDYSYYAFTRKRLAHFLPHHLHFCACILITHSVTPKPTHTQHCAREHCQVNIVGRQSKRLEGSARFRKTSVLVVITTEALRLLWTRPALIFMPLCLSSASCLPTFLPFILDVNWWIRK